MFRFGMTRFDVLTRSPDGDAGGAEGESENTGANGGATTGGTGAEQTDIQKQIDAAVAAAVALAVNGLKAKNSELIGKEKTLKAELAAANGKPSLTDAEYTEFRTLQERLQNDELLKLMAEGKSEDAIERITRRTRIDADAKLAAEAELRTRVQGEASEWKSKYEQTLISNEVTKAAASVSVKPQYTEIINNMVANKVKLVDGAIRVVNADGEIEMTANGAKPITVADYIETLRGTLPDLFAASSGGGAGGSNKKASGVGSSTKISVDAIEGMSMDDYARLRKEGKI